MLSLAPEAAMALKPRGSCSATARDTDPCVARHPTTHGSMEGDTSVTGGLPAAASQPYA